jgi:hypothetical protein
MPSYGPGGGHDFADAEDVKVSGQRGWPPDWAYYESMAGESQAQ